MKIGWAFTGAGHLLKESVESMEELAKDNDLTVFLSQASEEVLKMYGLYDRVVAVTGGRYNELASDSNQKFSFPITGRLSLGKYDLLIVSPTTANTVAKIVHGISDTLVTNAVAQAGKGRVRTLMVPVDIEPGDVETILPSKLEKTKCHCGTCKDICPYDAVSTGKIITMHMREIDIENTRKLEKMEGIEIFDTPENLLDSLNL